MSHKIPPRHLCQTTAKMPDRWRFAKYLTNATAHNKRNDQLGPETDCLNGLCRPGHVRIFFVASVLPAPLSPEIMIDLVTASIKIKEKPNHVAHVAPQCSHGDWFRASLSIVVYAAAATENRCGGRSDSSPDPPSLMFTTAPLPCIQQDLHRLLRPAAADRSR